MADFVDVQITVDPAVMQDAAIEGLRSKWDGWEPNDADPEVVVVEEVAPLMAQVAEIAASVPKEVFRKIGTDLFLVPYEAGAPAYSTVTLVFLDDSGYHLDAGDQLAIDGYAFQLVGAVDCPVGSTEVAAVPVQAVLDGAGANDLTGAQIDSLTLPAFVTGISLDAPTAAGVDDEDDDAYVGRVSRDLILRARTLVTARDFAIQALNNPQVARAYVEENTVRTMNVTLVGLDGSPTSGAVKAAVEADYESFGMVNLLWNVGDAAYNDVQVAYEVVVDPAMAPAVAESQINGLLASVLAPLKWGLPANTSTSTTVPSWQNKTTVSKNALIALLGSQVGVLEVVSVTLASSTPGAVVEANGDLTMSGAVPLPELGTVTPTIDYPS